MNERCINCGTPRGANLGACSFGGYCIWAPRGTEVVVSRTDLTADEAIARIRSDYPRDGGVMAQNYDSDCPNDDDHGPEGECECWDGLTVDDIETWTNPDGSIDVAGFDLWGPFQYWTTRTI